MPKKKVKLHDWGDGKGRIHTIPKSEHRQNVQMQRAGVNPAVPLTAPLSTRAAFGMAQGMAQADYAPQITAATQMGTNAPVWYQNYLTRAAAARAAAQTAARPILDQANAWANQPVTAAPGLDPSSPYAAQSQQAAQSQSGLAKLGADTLAAQHTATTDYLSSQQSIAARDLPQAQAYYAQEKARLEAERNAKANSYFNDIRTGEVNSDIAYQTLGLNRSKAEADTLLAAGYDPLTGKLLPADPLSPGEQKTQAELDYFNEHGYFPPTGPPESTTSKPKGLTPAQKQAAAERERTRVAGIRTESGKVLAKVQDAIGAWNSNATRTKTDPKTKKTVVDEKTGKPVHPSPAELKRLLQEQGYEPGLIHVALLRRVGKPLDQAAIDYLHSRGVRIPRSWLGYDPDIRAGSRKDPKAGMANP